MKNKFLFVKLFAALGIMIVSLQAQATISLSPSDCGTTYDCWTSTQNSTLTTAEVESLIGYTGSLAELYKMDVGGPESGPYASSYDTTFSNSATDPQDALIQYLTGQDAITCPDCYLLIKGGNADPSQYVFDIGTWNGMEDISLAGFWPTQGAISHVTIYGSPVTNKVPEPSALASLAMALLVLGAITRRRKQA